MKRWMKAIGAAMVVLPALFAGARAEETSTAPRLQFELTPYVWLPTIDLRLDSNVRSGTTATTDLSIGVGDYISKLNFAGMVAASARYERYSLFTDFLYLNANTGDSHVRSLNTPVLNIPVTNTVSASTRVQSTIWTLAGGYSVAEGTWGQVDLIGGVRMLVLQQNVNYFLGKAITLPNGTIGLSRMGSLSASGTIWNGIAGVRGRLRIPESRFYVPFHFDIGSGGAVWTWQAFAGIGYQADWIDVSAGYRYLAFEQRGNAILEKLSMGGPLIAATFRF